MKTSAGSRANDARNWAMSEIAQSRFSSHPEIRSMPGTSAATELAASRIETASAVMVSGSEPSSFAN